MSADGALQPQTLMVTSVGSMKLKFPRSRGAFFALVCWLAFAVSLCKTSRVRHAVVKTVVYRSRFWGSAAMFVFTKEKTRWFCRHVLPHEPGLRSWLARKRYAGIDVDDVIQETYTVLAAREHVGDIQNPRAYIFQVAHSIIVRHVRRAKVVSIQAIEEMGGFDPIDGAASLEQSLIDRDELRRLAEAIAAMPGQTRQAFILRRVHGHTQREIAHQMRLSESTVEKHIARGVRFLIDWYADGGKGASQRSTDLKMEKRVPHGRTRHKSGH